MPIWPDYVNNKIVDKDGAISDDFDAVISQTIFNLQRNFSDEGLVVPSKPTSVINQLAGSVPSGTLLWDSDTGELKVRKDDSSFHVIQTS